MLRAIKLHPEGLAIVDDEDYIPLLQFRWQLKSRGGCEYAWCHSAGFMHRLIMKPPPDLIVRHLDDIGIHNFKKNLKIATQSENMLNATRRMGKASPYPRGVTFNRGKFTAQIAVNRQMVYIGRYETPEEASKAYEARRETLLNEGF